MLPTRLTFNKQPNFCLANISPACKPPNMWIITYNSYNIFIGTSFMVQYDTVTNHGDHMVGILGHSIPMFYHSNRPSDLPLRCLHYINLDYTDGELLVAYTLCCKKIKVLPLSVGKAKGIPVYASCNVTIPPGSQVIHNTGLLLALPTGTHG
ncbi:hypothetical protein DSO57_1000724 [Entomophthora muscae]|uniref:Uncharacterized protein n=1 Tax=Entomophthora muscae TaxID=34485 RepID=A0ACC2SMK1_9FUNG|nr:hypothetical protein DSO57_1000724 [Entomophthora muscae]